MNCNRAVVFLILSLLFLPTTSVGQAAPSLDQGFVSYGSYQGGDIDSVNLKNGNLILDPPLLSYPQRGKLKLDFFIRYNNKGYQSIPYYISPGSTGLQSEWDGAGVQIGRRQALSFSQTSTRVKQPDGTYVNEHNCYVQGSDGSVHPLANRTMDASGTYGSASLLIDRDGIQYSLQTGGVQNPSGAGIVTDSNGNQITANGSGWTDTLGRLIPGTSTPTETQGQHSFWPKDGAYAGVPTSDYSSCPVAPVAARVWTVPTFNGTSNFKLCYLNYSYSTNFQVINTKETSGTATLLEAIVLPDGTYWQFDYNSYLDLILVKLPTGGTISYSYGNLPGAISRRVLSRSVDANDGKGAQTWTYAYTTGATLQTIVTDPLGNDTVHIFSDGTGYENETRWYHGSNTAGTLLKTVDTQYSFAANPSSGYSGVQFINEVPVSIRTTWPNGQVSRITRSYDPGVAASFYDPSDGSTTAYNVIFGNVLQQNEYDYGSGSPGTLKKQTITNYAWQSNANYQNSNLLDLPSSSITLDGASNKCVEIDYGYDDPNRIAGSGIATQHGAAPGAVRGNLSSISNLLSNTPCQAGASWTPITSYINVFDTGMKYQSVDALMHTTTYGYSSNFAGAYITQTQLPATGSFVHSISGNYDFNTGLLTSFTDQNNRTSAYTYDNLFRITAAKFPDGGSTTFTYPDPRTVDRKQKMDVSNVIETLGISDGLDRLIQIQLIDPEGTVYTDTNYDSLGRKQSISNPHRSNAGTTDGITQFRYDALGRTTDVIEPDSNDIHTDYFGNLTTITDETGRPKRGTTDAFERLIEVDEPTQQNVSAMPGSPAVAGWASVNIGGGEQSTQVGAASGTGTVNITGSETSYTDPSTCEIVGGKPTHCTTIYDTGTVTIAVNGYAKSTAYGRSSTTATLASAIAGLFQSDASSPVNAVSSGATITFTAKAQGASTNYPVSASSSTNDVADFGTPSFASTTSGSLTGGANATPVYDSGTVTVTVNGFSKVSGYNSGSTVASIASDLANQFNGDSSSPVSATYSQGSSSFTLTSKQAGANTNYPVSGSSATNNGQFSAPSFSAAVPGSLSGGNDAVPPTPGYTQPTFSPAYVTLYSYDGLDNLIRVDQEGNDSNPANWRTRTFAYDSFSRLLSANNPETGSIGYDYDGVGNLLHKSDARNVTTTYSYDALNRIVSKTFNDGTPAQGFDYDAASWSGILLGNPTGRLAHEGTANGVNQIFSYDVMGRLTNQYNSLPSGGTYNTTAAYDNAGHLSSLTYPSGRTITNSYNAAARLTGVNYTGVNYLYVSVANHYPFGAAMNSNFANGITETNSFNNRLQPTRIVVKNPSVQTYLDHIYGFNDSAGHNNGDVLSIADNLSSARTQTFGYDQLNRLSSASETAWGLGFVYDAWGNLLQQNVSLGSAPMLNIGVGSNNHMAGYAYDPAGNLLNDGSHNYSYDAEDRIKTVDSAATYTYAADGQRARKDVGSDSTEYIYFGGQVIAERKPSGDYTDYIYADGKMLAKSDSYQDRIHTSGTNCSNCGGQYSVFMFPNAGNYKGYVIRSGDKLFLQQWQSSGGHGGMIVKFSDSTVTNWAAKDQDGNTLNNDGMQTSWHNRRIDLSAYAGKTLTELDLVTESTTAAGPWDIYYYDISIVSSDGTVRPVYNQQPAITLNASGSAGVSGRSYKIDHLTNLVSSPQYTTEFYHADHLNSSRMMSSAAGYPVWQATYLPFGYEYNPQITVNKHKFTGKERDAESGLDFFGARYYSSSIGRFMTPDWAAKPEAVPYSDLADPQSLNLYGYVRNNPLSHADKDGHCYPFCTVALGAVVGAAAGAGAEYLTEFTQVHVDGTKILHAAEGGAIAGAITGLAGPEAGLAFKVGTSVAGQVIGGGSERALNGEKIVNGKEITKDAVAGAAGTKLEEAAKTTFAATFLKKVVPVAIETGVDAMRRSPGAETPGPPQSQQPQLPPPPPPQSPSQLPPVYSRHLVKRPQ